MIRSLSLNDLNSMDKTLVNEFASNVPQINCADNQIRIRVDGRNITANTRQTQAFAPSLNRPYHLDFFKISQYNNRRAAGRYKNTAAISFYETRRHFGLIKDTTGEELKEIRDFYRLNIDREEKNEDILEGKNEPQEKVNAMEEAIKRIMSFDLSLFNYKSYKDIVDSAAQDNGRFKKCRDIIRLGRDALNCIQAYEQCRQLGAECLLDEKLIKEVKARCMVMMQAGPFFDEKFLDVLESPALEKTGLSLDEIMHLSKQEINEKLDAAKSAKDDESERLWEGLRSIDSLLSGFDLGMDLNTFVPLMRFKIGCYGESLDKEILNILNKKASVIEGVKFGDMNIHCERDGEFLGKFWVNHFFYVIH